jgi:hypothetical protein
MGDRANIHLFEEEGDDGFYFYTHWGGTDLPEVLADALRRGRQRWDDPPYLARIIFSEMIKDEVLEETGYGISQFECDNDDYPIIQVNLTQRTVGIGSRTYTFEEFIEGNSGW